MAKAARKNSPLSAFYANAILFRINWKRRRTSATARFYAFTCVMLARKAGLTVENVAETLGVRLPTVQRWAFYVGWYKRPGLYAPKFY